MVLFFPLNLVYLQGLGGWCIPTLFVAATDGPRNGPLPFAFNCNIEASSITFREIGRAPLFCRLLLPLSDIPQICQDSNPQRATQKKSKRLSFQFIFRWAKLDARFSPYPIFKPFNPKKKKRKKPFCALSRTPFLSALLFPFPVLYSPTYPGPCILPCGLSIQGRRIGTGKNVVWQNDTRHQENTGKMVEISFPSPLVGGIPLLLSRRNLLPWGRSDWMAFLWREIDSMGARAGV